MSRFEGEFRAEGAASLDLVELLAAFSSGNVTDTRRGEAIACFLSASQGWKEAAGSLGGTFAARLWESSGLTGGKEE